MTSTTIVPAMEFRTLDLAFPVSESDSGRALRVGVCDSRGGRGWLELSYDEITSLGEVARGLYNLWALHTWRRERRYGLEYDITSPWPCCKVTYFGLDGKEVFVGGWSLGDFQGIVSQVCMSSEHVCVFLLKEEGAGQVRRGGDALARFSLADHDSYVGMAAWLHKLWGRHSGNVVAPVTWISRVADSWPCEDDVP